MEAFEDEGQLFGRNRGAAVLYADFDPRVLQAGGDRDGGVLGAVAQGVVDQILEDLADPAGIGKDGREIGRSRARSVGMRQRSE